MIHRMMPPERRRMADNPAVTDQDIEAIADEIVREHGPKRPRVKTHISRGTPNATGRPPALSRRDEWELYCYRKAGSAIKTCASMFRVSVPTANRIIAKFRAYDERVEPLAREFREKLAAVRDST
jgi:hypothetical protein